MDVAMHELRNNNQAFTLIWEKIWSRECKEELGKYKDNEKRGIMKMERR
jgi:hypothetical protein